MSNEKIELKLLDNGLHFLTIGMNSDSLYSGANQDLLHWKYAILNFYSGIELVLKDRLLREHWSLIFENIENASLQKIQSGDFISVNYNPLINRLNNISKIRLIATDENNINELRKLRNKIQHYEFSVTIIECKYIIAKALKAILDFIELNYKKIKLSPQQLELIEAIKYNSYNFKEYIEYKKNIHIDRLQKARINGKVSPCPICNESTLLSFKNKKSQCIICDYSCLNYETAMQELLNSIKDRTEKILVEDKCDCGENIFKYYNPMKVPPRITVFCFNCGDKESIYLNKENIKQR